MTYIFLIILLLIKFFVFHQLYHSSVSEIIVWSYIVLNLLASIGAFYYGITNSGNPWSMGNAVAYSRVLLIGFLITDVLMAIYFMLSKSGGFLFERMSTGQSQDISRRHFVQHLSLFLASIPFVGLAYGALFGKYNYKLHKEEWFFDDLPEAFDSYKLVQFSDFHAGSFDNISKVEKGLSEINALNPDLILFTGDMVNLYSEEMKPFLSSLSQLTAKDGKISILGNHDYYGEHYKKKIGDVENLVDLERMAGFTVLRNEFVQIKCEESHINILGVENWGRGGFSKYGDIDKTLKGVKPDDFSILLSHDPTHWDEKIKMRSERIAITLSGHTHGMQFGIELPFLRWSPIQYVYKKWAGRYDFNDKILYINRGFGYLWLSARVGIRPEITQIILRKKK